MMRPAHVSAGLASAAATAWLLGGCPAGLQAVAAALWGVAGSLAPDYDLRRGHRVLGHNLVALAAFTVLAYAAMLLLGAPTRLAVAAALAASTGYASHLLLDALTVRGVALLYPLSRRRYRLARLRSSSAAANAAVVLASWLFFTVYALRCGLGAALPG